MCEGKYLRTELPLASSLEEVLAADADTLSVAFPEALGDNYTALLINLGKVAESKNQQLASGSLIYPPQRPNETGHRGLDSWTKRGYTDSSIYMYIQ